MGKIQMMVDYAVNVANNDKHGYSQMRRWPSQGTDFDCATLMYCAANHAGYKISIGPSATRYTGTMLEHFKAAGFTALRFDGNLNDLDPGDILLNTVHHTEMYIGDGKFVGAHIAETGDVDGKPGDQTGDEISIVPAYIPDFGWDYVLVPPKETASKPKATNVLDGIDISSHQEGIDISKVKADFVIVKVSGGTSYVNPYWRKWAGEVIKAGKLLGLYHFACENGTEPGGKAEAAYFLKQIRGYEGKAVLCLDWEAHAKDMPISYAREWLATVASQTGATPMFYAEAGYINSVDCSAIKKYPLWMCSYLSKYENGKGYVSNPDNIWAYGAWSKMTMYQYASTRIIQGYSGRLDCNVYYGTKADWQKLAGDGKAAAPIVPGQPRYRVFCDGKWQAWHSAGTTAGKLRKPIMDVDFSGLPSGSWWRLTLSDGTVLKKGKHNTARKKPVTGLEVYYETPKSSTALWEAYYRVHVSGGTWLKWEHDVDDGGAGGAGPIDKMQFKIREV